jgi:hypothetical protein
MMMMTTPTYALQNWQQAANPVPEKLSNQSAEPFGLHGKAKEFTMLLKQVEQGQSKLCLILGDAGSGKSVLLQALQVAIHQQTVADAFPAKHQVLFIDFLSYDATQLATHSFFAFVLMSFTQWVNQLEVHCLALLNKQTPEGFELTWTQESLLALITKANQQPSLAQRRAFLEVHIQTELRAQQNWVDKLFTPIKETIQVLVETLDNPWVTLLVECQQTLVPKLVSLAEQRETSQQAGAVFEKQLLACLLHMTTFFKQQLSSAASGEATFTIIVDNWDVLVSVLSVKQRQHYLAELTALATVCQENKQQPLHLLLGVRTDELAKTLGTTAYNLFRLKLLLPALTPQATKAMIEANGLLPSFLQVPKVLDWLEQKAQGNAYWVGLLCAALHRKVQAVMATDTTEMTEETLERCLTGLAVEQATDCHAFLLTQLQLGVVEHGVGYGEALQYTVSALTNQPFDVPVFLERMNTVAPQLVVNDVALVLRKLFLFGCLKEVASAHKPQAHHAPSATAPQYQVVHRLLLGYLKARLTQSQLSQQFNLLEQQESNWFEGKQQLETLKTILPLTLEQGELTLEKVQGLLNLAQQFQPEFQQEFQQFFITLLETAITCDVTPTAVKQDALLGLGQLNQERFIPLLLEVLQHAEATSSLQATVLTILNKQGTLLGGHFASTYRATVLQQLLALFSTEHAESFQTTVLKAIEAWAFPLKQEIKPLLLSFLQGFLSQSTTKTEDLPPIPAQIVHLVNQLLVDPQVSEAEKAVLLPEVMCLVQHILQADHLSGSEALRLVKHYAEEDTPEPLFALLEKLANPSVTNTQPLAIKQAALALLLVRFTGRDAALQAWLNQLEEDLKTTVSWSFHEDEAETEHQAIHQANAFAMDCLLHKRISLASKQRNWPDWAKQQLQQVLKSQLNSRAWEAWLPQPDLLWVLLKCWLTMSSESKEETAMAKQWLKRLESPTLEASEGIQ